MNLQKDWENLTEEDKEEVCEGIFQLNGGMARPRVENVSTNPVMRQLAKIFLNCLWGKLCQKGASEEEAFVYGFQQYIDLLANPDVNQESVRFRQVNGSVYKARYKRNKPGAPNQFLNVYVAASVTAHAQVILMRQMLKVGPKNMLYCDTDSVVFLREKGLPRLDKAGLGNWAIEHGECTTLQFVALAPKCYLFRMQNQGGHVEEESKCKGVTQNAHNREVVCFENLKGLVGSAFANEEAPLLHASTMTIYSNSVNSLIPYGSLCTRYGEKQVRIVFNKRQLLMDGGDRKIDDMALIRLVPFGYEGDLDNF